MTVTRCFALCLAVVGAPGQVDPASSAIAALDAADRLKAPFPAELRRELKTGGDSREVWLSVQPQTLLEVEINPEMRVKAAAGPAPARLIAGRSQAFLIRIDNACGTTSRLALKATDLAAESDRPPEWLDIEIADVPGCTDRLSGAAVEYKLLICRVDSPGRREVRLGLDAGQGTQDLGFRGVVDILFRVESGDAR